MADLKKLKHKGLTLACTPHKYLYNRKKKFVLFLMCRTHNSNIRSV